MMSDAGEPELLPARMINEYVYCPRLFWLEHIEREFEESYDTVDGQRVHRRVDESRGVLPETIAEEKSAVTSVELASPSLGVVAKIDLVRLEDGRAVPIDFKRGHLPPADVGVYEPERVQVVLQALLLREQGYVCDEARVYYAASKTYVSVPINEGTIAEAIAAVAGARAMLTQSNIPPPLINSPKCARCSLNVICLPDETNLLKGADLKERVRPFSAPSDDRVPLYVMQPGARVGLSGEVVQVRDDKQVIAEVRLLELLHISMFGNVQISSQAMRAVLGRSIPVFYLSYGGWLTGYARSIDDHSLDLRIAQHAAVADEALCVRLARGIVYGKVKNQRTMVRRHRGDASRLALQSLSALSDRVAKVRDREALLGLEGMAAKHYFEAFGEMLDVATGFEVSGRNRRPPTDPVNAMLSLGYAMLAREALAAVTAVGFEPGLGFYHRVRAGRPSLALDLMEEFRPLIVDSTVLRIVNNQEIRASDFDRRGRGIALTADGRRLFIAALEHRLRDTITHPIFGYPVTYRRALHVQARLLARAVQGDIPEYPAFTTR